MLYPMELKLMELIWAHAPVTASHLCRLSAQAIGWKRTTCYTVVARLAERGYIERRGSLVIPLLTREMAEDMAVRSVLADYFGGARDRLEAALNRVVPDGAKTIDKSAKL